ncbi:protein TPRXL [Microbacterium album]|uniref:Uncharacterized protein n=1 Tax=Microbacterium album TaxID=2053191 RepID=A0A917IGY9_9MICO|nr:protein TPRXL [Microbacterium album]GGH42895.1 hypothetical protein GCM10010921_16400 [Microbacterium album]
MTETSGRISLREELGAAPDPDFELTLLPGWTKWVPDEGRYVEMGSAIRRRFAELGRTDLMSAAQAMLADTFADLRRQSVIAVFSATEERDETIWLPGSIVASIRRGGPDYSLDELVSGLIREFGAEPLFGDKRFIRYARVSRREVEGQVLRVKAIEYLTPVPAGPRTRALALTASFGAPASVPEDDTRLKAYELAFDAMVSTLRWVPPRPTSG